MVSSSLLFSSVFGRRDLVITSVVVNSSFDSVVSGSCLVVCAEEVGSVVSSIFSVIGAVELCSDDGPVVVEDVGSAVDSEVGSDVGLDVGADVGSDVGLDVGSAEVTDSVVISAIGPVVGCVFSGVVSMTIDVVLFNAGVDVTSDVWTRTCSYSDDTSSITLRKWVSPIM